MKRPRPPKGTGEHGWDEYHRKAAEYEAWEVERRNRPRRREQREAGYGTMDGRPVYYELGNRPGRLEVFPDGMPSRPHETDPHGHYIIDNGELVYMRDSDGQVYYDERPGDFR